MGSIALLDELTINKIAAGEVIERPASVIKEMVENSIDANATNITIEIRNGGISYIKITDNGKGIAQDDLEIAFERHATSKIRSAKDLEKVKSMGFRGEALASIAAISSIELISKTAFQSNGYKITLEGGRILEKTEIGCQTGTSITVRNLFYNTPVRYKFLKKDYTETGYIEDIVTRLALINPNVAIKLINTGKTILSTSGNGNLKDVIYSIYGKDIAQGVIDVNYKYEDINITGVIGRPEISRSNRSNQLFFVNKRFIKDRILTSATEQAYKNVLEQGKFAFLVLNIEMPTNKVDVNVHPAKLEVRFEEENKVFKAIFHAIENALLKENNNVEDNIIKMDNVIIQNNDRNDNINNIRNYNINDNITYDRNSNIKNIRNNAYNNNVRIEKNNTEINNFDKNETIKESKFSSFLNRRKNKYDFGSNNIIEDLYNQKQTNELNSARFNEELENKTIEDNIVNTSDVLQELKNINKNIQAEIKQEKDENKEKNENNEIEKNTTEGKNIENPNEIKDLPDGKTYTYEGKNKEKIENLLRELHPEIAKTENKVAEPIVNYNIPREETIETVSKIEENRNNLSSISSKFDLIRQNLEKINSSDLNIEKSEKIDFFAEEIEDENTEIQKDNNEIVEEKQSNEIENKEINENIQNNEKKENDDKLESNEKTENDDKLESNETIENNEKSENNDKIENEYKTKQNVEENIPVNIEKEENRNTKKNEIENINLGINDFDTMYEKLFGTKVINEKEEKQKEEELQKEKINAIDIVESSVSMFEGIKKYNKPTYKIIGIVFESYIVAEIEKEMFIINEKIAREKLMFEYLKNNYNAQEIKDSQMLLLPDIINLTEKEMEVAKENIQMFTKAGFVLEEFGNNTLKLSGVPDVCVELNTKELIVEIIDGINTVARTDIREKVNKILEVIASKVTEKQNKITTIQEVEELMEKLLSLNEPFKYFENKQVALKMTKYDIERKFSRK